MGLFAIKNNGGTYYRRRGNMMAHVAVGQASKYSLRGEAQSEIDTNLDAHRWTVVPVTDAEMAEAEARAEWEWERERA